MPNEPPMSDERKAIMDWLQDQMSINREMNYTLTADVLELVASELAANIPLAPAERWPRCPHGHQLESYTYSESRGGGVKQRWDLYCYECNRTESGETADEALAAFRAAERERKD